MKPDELEQKLAAVLDEMADCHRHLAAPFEGGEPRKWLPCDDCKRVVAMPLRVVSFVCDDCPPPSLSYNAPTLYE